MVSHWGSGLSGHLAVWQCADVTADGSFTSVLCQDLIVLAHVISLSDLAKACKVFLLQGPRMSKSDISEYESLSSDLAVSPPLSSLSSQMHFEASSVELIPMPITPVVERWLKACPHTLCTSASLPANLCVFMHCLLHCSKIMLVGSMQDACVPTAVNLVLCVSQSVSLQHVM